MAALALKRNIMRSALTTLGIIIGIAAVIAMVEIGQGSKKAVAESIQSLGANTLLVLPGQASSGGVSFGGGSSPTLTPGDAEAIQKDLPAAAAVALIVRTRTQLIYQNKNWVPVYIYGTTNAFLDVREWGLTEGRMFSKGEEESSSCVCLIGQTILREMFDNRSPIDQIIRVNNIPLKVVGVLARKGANTFGADQDDILLCPWRTIKFKISGQMSQVANASTASAQAVSAAASPSSSTRYPSQQPSAWPAQSATELQDFPPPLLPTYIDQILIRINSEGEIPSAIRLINTILRERHRLRTGVADDFYVRDMTEIAKAQSSTSQMMSLLLVAVAMISLIVGGVGIMNIMLVSVTERTKEIGLRMAVGARARDILRQFLVEAVLLCILGGIMGVLVGLGGSWAVRNILHWRTERSFLAMLAAVSVSAVVGVVFGYYPAWKASRLDPIEALRYE
jgi:ABC-type antimicrobial peptide transport system permease subunit